MTEILQPLGVKMHPIALLSVVDHFERAVGNKKNKRVLGALLGEEVNGVYELTNAYALPFDENPKMPGVWFVDQQYHEEMYHMFKKVNIKEKFLGWYVSGNTYQNNDIQIHELFSKYCQSPVMIVVNVDDQETYELPTKAFTSQRQLNKNGIVEQVFNNIPCQVSAFEAEEVGVEHLVREIKDLNMNSLKTKLNGKLKSIQYLSQKIEKLEKYLEEILQGRIKPDQQILMSIQQVLGVLGHTSENEIQQELSKVANKNYHHLYLSSIVQSVIKCHEFIDNQLNIHEEQKLQKQKIQTTGTQVKINQFYLWIFIMNLGLRLVQKLSFRSLRIASKQVRMFSTLKQREKDFKTKIEKEIKEETEADQQEINQEFLEENGWELQNSLETSQIKLTKEKNGKTVTIVFNARVPPMEEEQEGEQQDQQEQNVVEFVVCIDNKKGKQLVAEVMSVDLELSINNIFVTSKGYQYITDKTLTYTGNEYLGPVFDTLEEGVQDSIYNILDEYGINEDLAEFIEETSLLQEQKLYVKWLKNLNEFIQQKLQIIITLRHKYNLIQKALYYRLIHIYFNYYLSFLYFPLKNHCLYHQYLYIQYHQNYFYQNYLNFRLSPSYQQVINFNC